MTGEQTSAEDLPVILHNDKRGLLTVEDGRLDVIELSKDGRPPKRLLSGSIRNLLRIKLSDPLERMAQRRRIDIHTLIQRDRDLRISKMHVLVDAADADHAVKWAQYAMAQAYPDVNPYRRVLLLVNPIGGKGKSKKVVKETVMPILEAAGCKVDVRETTHRLHAEEIASEIPLDYDVIASASGDGSVYEVFNGLGRRPDGLKAFQIPVAPIPTGSANALSINLFGPKDTFNVPLACLNVIKGKPLPLDMCSILVLPSNTRRFSFLATALGLMVDLDIGTENMRWMGDARFFLGFLRGIATNKSFSCRLKIKVVEDDKISMARKARERVQAFSPPILATAAAKSGPEHGADGASAPKPRRTSTGVAEANARAAQNGLTPVNGGSQDGSKAAEVAKGPVPEMKPLEPDESWLTIDTSARSRSGSPRGGHQPSLGDQGLLYFYAGLMPWVARDLMQWPVATSGQGLIDVVVQPVVPRKTLIGAITGAEKGEAYWMDCQHYFKASAIVAENLDPEKQKMFTIDGEAFEFSSFHLEVHPRLAHTLSLDDQFFVSEFLKKNYKSD